MPWGENDSRKPSLIASVYIHRSKAQEGGKVMELDGIMWNYVEFTQNYWKLTEIYEICENESEQPL